MRKCRQLETLETEEVRSGILLRGPISRGEGDGSGLGHFPPQVGIVLAFPVSLKKEEIELCAILSGGCDSDGKYQCMAAMVVLDSPGSGEWVLVERQHYTPPPSLGIIFVLQMIGLVTTSPIDVCRKQVYRTTLYTMKYIGGFDVSKQRHFSNSTTGPTELISAQRQRQALDVIMRVVGGDDLGGGATFLPSGDDFTNIVVPDGLCEFSLEQYCHAIRPLDVLSEVSVMYDERLGYCRGQLTLLSDLRVLEFYRWVLAFRRHMCVACGDARAKNLIA